MKILIDTNILIQLEDTGRRLDSNLAKMKQLVDENGHSLYVHPIQKDDIGRDPNQERREIVLSRFDGYQQIPSPPELTSAQLEEYGWRESKPQDRVDNRLLYALRQGAVHLFVTYDIGIHKNARKVGIGAQVYRPEELLAILKDGSEKPHPPPSGIQELFLHQIDVEQDFFDSLRDGYDEFNRWYRGSAEKGRKAWCALKDNGAEGTVPVAICIHKLEKNCEIADGQGPLPGRILKLCTFKVAPEIQGRKFGERLLYAAFRSAVTENYDWIYLHIRENQHEGLAALCENYGFELYGTHRRQEGLDNVYLKRMSPQEGMNDLPAMEYARKFYPHYMDGEEVGKYLIPIMPKYHDKLFADTSRQAQSLFADSSYPSQSLTIKKAYISRSPIRSVKAGDLVFFYRSHDRHSVECMGIVEQAKRSRDPDEVLSLVSKRTVYSPEEIREQMENDGEVLVILFWHLRDLEESVSLSDLKRQNVGAPQSIRSISHSQYVALFQKRADHG